MGMQETRVIAHALYDSLIGETVRSLRVAADTISALPGEKTVETITAALPTTLTKEARNLVIALAHEGRLGQLNSVILDFEQIARSSMSDAQPLDGEVTSAVVLDDGQRARIEADLHARYGTNLTIRFKVDESLLGGLIIRVGDRVLDNSLRTRLSVIQRNMALS